MNLTHSPGIIIGGFVWLGADMEYNDEGYYTTGGWHLTDTNIYIDGAAAEDQARSWAMMQWVGSLSAGEVWDTSWEKPPDTLLTYSDYELGGVDWYEIPIKNWMEYHSEHYSYDDAWDILYKTLPLYEVKQVS